MITKVEAIVDDIMENITEAENLDIINVVDTSMYLITSSL